MLVEYSPKITVVIPVYNEMATIEEILARVQTKQKKNSLKLRERPANVYENKWPDFVVPERHGNVTEKKGVMRLIRECC